MNQKECIADITAKMELTNAQIKVLVAEFDEKYKEEQLKLNALGNELQKVYNKIKHIKLEASKKVSTNPEGFISSYDYAIKPEIITAIKNLIPDMREGDIRDIICHAFWDYTKPLIASLEEETHKIHQKINDIQTPEYHKAYNEIDTLKHTYNSMHNQLLRFQDLTKFRQWAKDKKASDISHAFYNEEQKKKDQAQEWVRKNIFS
jgi:hypothetical protein